MSMGGAFKADTSLMFDASSFDILTVSEGAFGQDSSAV